MHGVSENAKIAERMAALQQAHNSTAKNSECKQESLEERLWWQQPFCPGSLEQPTGEVTGFSMPSAGPMLPQKVLEMYSQHQWQQAWQMQQQLQHLHQMQQFQLEQAVMARSAQLPYFTLQQQIQQLQKLSAGQDEPAEPGISSGLAPDESQDDLARLQLQQLQQLHRLSQEQTYQESREANRTEFDAKSTQNLNETGTDQEDKDRRLVSPGSQGSVRQSSKSRQNGGQVVLSLQQELEYPRSPELSQPSAASNAYPQSPELSQPSVASSASPPPTPFVMTNSPVLNFQLSLDAGASDDPAAESKDDADLSQLIQLECVHTSQDALAAVKKVLHRLTPEMTLAALHLVARTSSAPHSKQMNLSDLHALLTVLQQSLPKLRSTRSLSRLSWSLGKLEVLNREVEVAIMHICSVAPPFLPKFSCQDLTNTLWGIARLYPASAAKAGRGSGSRMSSTASSAVALSAAIVSVCCERLHQLSAQCLSNALWSAARIGIRGLNAEDFLWHSLMEISTNRQLSGFSPQGLANMSWAIAEFKSAGVGWNPRADRSPSLDQLIRTTCVALCSAAGTRMAEFQHQELSMLAWAMAKVNGRSTGSEAKNGSRRKMGKAARVKEIDRLMICLAEEAHRRLPQLSPQSVSNLAWALATMDMLTASVGSGQDHRSAREFVCAACEVASEKLSEYSPQAVANLLWAAVRTEPEANSNRLPQEVNKLASAAARETATRLLEFSWRDLAGVAVAVSHRNLRVPEAWTFATTLVGMATVHCHELTPQLMLNIAQSSVRIGVDADRMQLLVDAIAQTIQSRDLKLNDVDLRQWKEVQNKCPTSWDRQDQAHGYRAAEGPSW